VTTDRVESSSFGSGNLGLTIKRQGRSDIAFNTATDAIPGLTSQLVPPVAGYDAREWTVFTHDNDSASAAYVAATWNNSDHTDYLAGGFWLHLEGDVRSLNFERAEVGAFVDGPELDGTPTIPTAGSATYQGIAGGLYAYRYGSSRNGVPERSFEFGDYSTVARLSADFDDMAVRGCIGCGGPASVSGWVVSQDGNTTVPFSATVNANATLAPTDIRSDGTFVGTGINLQVENGQSTTSSNGSWGGKFSNVSVAGAPRLAAGTTGVNWTENDGSSGSLVGAFFAVQQ